MSPASVRVRAPKPENIPSSLKREHRWVTYKIETRVNEKTGEPYKTKVPYNVLTGERAKTDDYTTWASFEQAWAAYLRGGYDGIGYMLGRGQMGLDLDGCYVNGVLESWAEEILATVHSFAEKSVNDGAHVIANCDFEPPEGQIEKDFPDRDHHGIAFYVFPRFIAMTTVRLNDHDVTDQTAVLDQLHWKYYPERNTAKRKRRKKAQAAAEDTDAEPTEEPAPEEPLTDDDKKLVALARAAKNGAKFSKLWDGQWQADYSGDQSRADAALLRILAYWTGKDPSRIERLFSHSKLGQREKWRARADYRDRSIRFALETTIFRKYPQRIVSIDDSSSQKKGNSRASYNT